MSDTVKFIIEIPKKEYEAFKELIAINIGGRCSGKGIIQTCLIAVKNGTPLEDIKAEIEKKCDRINSIASVLRYPQHREIQELLCEILESIDKAESEVKPNETDN